MVRSICRKTRLAGAIVLFGGVLISSPVYGQSFCFDPAIPYPSLINPSSVVAAPLDLDGNLDLAVANAGGGSGKLAILTNGGGGVFGPAVYHSAGAFSNAIVAAHLDGNPGLDLAIANNGSDNVSVFLNDGVGGFPPLPTNYAAGDGPYSLAAADFDGDGYNDLVIADDGSGLVSILTNDGSGGFSITASYPAAANPRSVVAGDFDGQDGPDVAVVATNSGELIVYFNDGAGNLIIPSDTYPTGGLPWSVTAADLDLDGDLDLAVANYDDVNDVAVFRNDGAGGFSSSGYYTAGASCRSITAADLDCDGYPDLAVANFNGNNISLFRNEGPPSWAFGAAEHFAVGSGPLSVTAADLDGDGDRDLATANYFSADISVLMGCCNCDRTCDIFAGEFPVYYETRAGNRDDFTTFDGPEVAAPDAPLQAYLSTCGASPLICPPGIVGPMFDCEAIDQCFGHTFYQTWDTSRCIIDASLCFQVAAIGSGSINDRLLLMEDGLEIWSIDMNQIRALQTSGADPTWGGGSADTMEYCINLTNLPAGGIGPTDILPTLQDADLDVVFEMNTMVDYVQLDVTVCCTGCVADGDIDGDGGVWSVADQIALTRFVEGVGPAPIPLCRADLNADGMIDQADVDLFDCVFTYGVGPCLETYPVPTPCIQDTIRGCCIENDSCFIRSPSNCAARGGLYLGDGAVECCWCPHQGDVNGDGFVDAVDLAILIDIVFFGFLDVQDPCCPTSRADFDGNGVVDAVDLALLIDHVFFGGPGPVDPCEP
ncbi:MAG: FG-GAP-like repeat-containing protein [Candidatus Zixiibacteriota bacterium]